ncbi:MAG TPA: carbohydrate binding domain-containing protein [Candidatus Saccharimonadales bacterium]|nr:carbohydrate binding domain-containing protein [Candidatus Saccharimonadales bacterium]
MSSGNCSGSGSSNTLQAAYDAGNSILATNGRDLSVALGDTATDPNFLIDLQCDTTCGANGRFAIQDDGVDVLTVLPAGGAATLQNSVNSTAGFNVKNAIGNNLFTVDTTNSVVGINLGSNITPTISNGLQLSGGIDVIGSATHNFLTPLGTNINSRLSVSVSDPGAFGQQIAVGLSASANVNSRGITVTDARTGTHLQPSITVISPNENEAFGLSWQGSNTTAYLLTADVPGSTRDIVVTSGVSTGTTSSTGNVTIKSGNHQGSGGTTGSVFIISGDGEGANNSSGSVVVDTGTQSGTGTIGGLLFGTTHASAITIGRSGLTTSNAGGLTVAQLLTTPTLGAADTAALLCRNSSNQVAGCNTTGTGAAFVQGGNSFGATGVLGTNDGFDLNFKTAGNTVATLSGANGSALFKNSTNSATAFQVQDAASAPLMAANTATRTGGVAGNLIKIGDSTGTDTATTILQLDSTTADPTTNLAALNGGLFYNSTTNKVSLIENGQVKIICNTTDLGCGTGTVTLQGAYTNSTGGATSEIILDNTRGALDIQDRSTSNGGTIAANLLNVRATAATDGAAGALLLGVGNTGAVLLQNSVNSASALQVKNALGTATAFDVDTTNTRVGIGTVAPARTLDIATNDANSTAPALRLLQGGTGDATIELNTPATSIFLGVDNSDGGSFKISSTAADGATVTSGQTGTPTNFDSGNNGQLSTSQITSSASAGTLNTVSVYFQNANGNAQASLYADTGADAPGALLATGVSQATVEGWNTFAMPTTAITATTKYWISFNVTSSTLRYGSQNVGKSAYKTVTYGTWPNPFGAPSSTNNSFSYYVYMTYTPSGSIDSFNGNLFALTTAGSATFKNSTDSTTGFQVQNSSANSIITVKTSDSSTTNLITNSGFEKGTAGWIKRGNPNPFTSATSQHHSGNNSLNASASGAANDGAKYNVTLADSSNYIFTFYIKIGIADPVMTTLAAGYSSDGATDNTACSLSATGGTSTGWTRVKCAFTTPASHSGTPYVYVKQTDASSRDMFFDDFFLGLDTSTATDTSSNGSIDLQGAVSSPLRLQASTNMTDALTIQNTSGANILNVGTLDNNGNSITNPSFELNTVGWSASGAGTTIVQDPTQAWIGTAALKVTTSTTALAGAAFNTTASQPTALAINTTYTMSWYAKLSSGSFTDIKARYTRNGASFVECTPTAQTVTTNGWTRFTCTFTTDGTAPTASADVRIVQTAATAHTFWIDGVRLELGGTAMAYGTGSVSFDAVINSPATFRNTADSTNAFSIQSASGNDLFNVDTTRNIISVLGGVSASLGGWSTTSAINGGSPAARYGSTSATANGYVYVLGGTSNSASTFANNVYYAKVNADGTISGTWNSGTNLPYTAYKASSFIANGYLYYIGGYDGTNTRSDAVYARINADGSLGAWQTAALVAPGRSSSSIAYLNGYVYVIGGFNNSIFVGTTSYAKVNADGSLGAWQTATGVLPAAATTARTSAAAANGYIYLMGGSSDNTPANGKTTVYYVQPNASTGDIGSNWSTSANSLPAAAGRTGATALVSNGNVYYMGGIDTSSAVQTSIYYSPLPAGGGDLGTWNTSISVLGAARWDATSVIVNGYMYEIGGNSSSATTTSVSTIYYATTPRLQVGGSIDLVGLQNATLADSGSDQSTGSTGGSITAGNGMFVGSLQIQGQATFNQTITVNGTANFQNTTNSTSAFTVLNASTVPQFSIDTTNSRVYIGNPTADTTGALLVLDNKSTTGDPAGVNGAMYYNSAQQQYRCFRDSNWEPCGINPIDRGFMVQDEFLGGQTTQVPGSPNGTVGELGWYHKAIGTITGEGLNFNPSTPTPVADRPGVLAYTTPSATSNSGETFTLATDNGGSMLLSTGNVMKTAVAIDSTSNMVLRIGLDNEIASTTQPVSGVWWEFDPAADATHWRYCTGDGTTRTCASDTNVTATANAWVSLEIRVTATGAGTSAATFIINGNSHAVSAVTIDTTNRISPSMACYNTTAAVKNCFWDYFQLRGTASGVR